MRKIFLLTIISIIWFQYSKAQSENRIEYKYDDAGNRINYEVILYQELRSIDSIVTTLLSDRELLDQFGIRIYPNPTHDLVFIEKTVEMTSNAQIYLIRGDGKLVSIYSSNTNKIVIDFSHEAVGLYILNFNIEKRNYRYKIIKN